MSQTEAVMDGENIVLPPHVQSAEDRFHALEQHVTYLTQRLQNVENPQTQTPTPSPPPPPPTQPNLNLPTPPYFSGVPSELFVFESVHPRQSQHLY